jgi:hypothetical protein
MEKIKSVGKSCDVIENKLLKIRGFRLSCDVDENYRLIRWKPAMFMKTQALGKRRRLAHALTRRQDLRIV